MWYAIILAGGSGTRMGAECNKVFLRVAGVPAIIRSVQAFYSLIDGLVVVGRTQDLPAIRQLMEEYGLTDKVLFAQGGDDRQASVWNGLSILPEACSYVMVHDAARCLIDEATIQRVKTSVEICGTGVAAISAVDTMKAVDDNEWVVNTPDRATLRAVQTPQGFTKKLLLSAHLHADQTHFRGTDDASLLEHMGSPVKLVQGCRNNIKLTTPEDLVMANAIMNSSSLPMLRVGQGYDVHRLVEGRKLFLCGVEIPHTLGLLGHSDADVALHALCDAMLGAMALGDIGKHFPDTEEQYRGISSMILLQHVAKLLAEHHAMVTNADVTIVAQKPKLLPFIPQMRQNIADALSLPIERINVKATTTEKLGFEGKEEGISAQAIVMVQQ